MTREPDAIRRQVNSRLERIEGWCPPEWRAHRRYLIRNLGYTATEARELIEADIPGTEAHAKRAIANVQDAMRIKRERDLASAY